MRAFDSTLSFVTGGSTGIGLAVASETPVTILNVMRGGPSTGIPTKSEQSDLNIALFGLHGDAPLPRPADPTTLKQPDPVLS